MKFIKGFDQNSKNADDLGILQELQLCTVHKYDYFSGFGGGDDGCKEDATEGHNVETSIG